MATALAPVRTDRRESFYDATPAEIEAATLVIRDRICAEREEQEAKRERFLADRARVMRERRRMERDTYTPLFRVPVPFNGPLAMTQRDICNVEAVSVQELAEALSLVTVALGYNPWQRWECVVAE